MKSVALHKAKEHLKLAKEAATKLTLEDGFKPYERAWTEFLAQVSRLYSKMEQGSKGCGKSEAWFGRKKHDRKKDPLLSYLHHARDCEEHGIDYGTALRADETTIKFPQTAEVSFRALVKVNEDGSVDMRDATVVTPDGEFSHAEHVNPRVELVTVKDDRFHDSFDPPNEHLGKPLEDVSPPTVAALAISYLERLLEEASELPSTV